MIFVSFVGRKSHCNIRAKGCEYLNEKEKRWVEMGMLVGKRWRVLDVSNYIWKKENKVESTHANRAFSFLRRRK